MLDLRSGTERGVMCAASVGEIGMSNHSWALRVGTAAVLASAVGLTGLEALADGGGRHGHDRAPLVFSEVDANADGGVDAAELLAWIESRRLVWIESVVEGADGDGDGVLSEAELQELANRRGRWMKWR